MNKWYLKYHTEVSEVWSEFAVPNSHTCMSGKSLGWVNCEQRYLVSATLHVSFFKINCEVVYFPFGFGDIYVIST